MFNFNKTSQEDFLKQSISDFISKNPIMVETDLNLHLSYNKDTDMYEALLKMPWIDNDLNEIKGINNLIVHSYAPLVCQMSKQIIPLDEYNSIEFNKTKVEKLEKLLSEIKYL